jgi:hypothetical protein
VETSTFPYLEAELKENALDPRHRVLIIDNKFISYDDMIMSCADITAIRYGSMQMLVFHRLRTERYYRIELRDNKENVMKIFFGISKLSSEDGVKEENYDKIINSLWHAVKKRLVNEALEKVENGGSFSVGDCIVSKNGVQIMKKNILNKKNFFITWEMVRKKVGFGVFYVYSNDNKRNKCRINFLHTWNSVVLFSVLEFFLKKTKLVN